MRRITSHLPTLAVLVVVAALAAAAVLTHGGQSESKGTTAQANSGGLMDDPAGVGPSLTPKHKPKPRGGGSDVRRPRRVGRDTVASGPVAPHPVPVASAPSPGMPELGQSGSAPSDGGRPASHAAPRAHPKAHANLPTPRSQPRPVAPAPRPPSNGTPGTAPTNPGATPTTPGATPPPATSTDPDAGLDDTPVGGLDQTDLGEPVDETPDPPPAATPPPAPQPAPAPAPAPAAPGGAG
jgi:hypothetical protein